MKDTTIRIKHETYRSVIHGRGILEHNDGIKRSIDDVIREVFQAFIKRRGIL